MFRAYRVLVLVPALIAMLNLLAIWAAGGPCFPNGSGDGC